MVIILSSGDFKPVTGDLCFKYIFSKKHILEDFINSFLEYINIKEKFKFMDITPERIIMPNNKSYKIYYGDIIAILNNQNIISLEMYKDLFTKAKYNKSFAYMNRLFGQNIAKNGYKKAAKVISINLIKGNFRRINKNLINIYNFKNEDGERIDNGNTEMYLIRLDKLENIQYTGNKKRFITWLRIINSDNIKEIKKYSEGDEIMSDVEKFVSEWCRESGKGGFERYVKEREEEAAEKAEKKGKKAGILETAKNLLSLNIDLKDIKKATGLSEKELNKLKKEIC